MARLYINLSAPGLRISLEARHPLLNIVLVDGARYALALDILTLDETLRYDIVAC